MPPAWGPAVWFSGSNQHVGGTLTTISPTNPLIRWPELAKSSLGEADGEAEQRGMGHRTVRVNQGTRKLQSLDQHTNVRDRAEHCVAKTQSPIWIWVWSHDTYLNICKQSGTIRGPDKLALWDYFFLIKIWCYSSSEKSYGFLWQDMTQCSEAIKSNP